MIKIEQIEAGYSYGAYRALIDQLLLEHKTTGTNQEESLVEYAKLNQSRMRRLEKTWQPSTEVAAALQKINRPLLFLTLTEGWCGDAAQIVPILEKMIQLIPDAKHVLLLRDEHLDIMDQFLTNGKSRSIPKTILMDASTLEVLGNWGPRPDEAQAGIDELKAAGKDMEEIKTFLHAWYAKDKGLATESAFFEVIQTALG